MTRLSVPLRFAKAGSKLQTQCDHVHRNFGKSGYTGSSPWAANVSGCSKRTRDVEKEKFSIMMVFIAANHV